VIDRASGLASERQIGLVAGHSRIQSLARTLQSQEPDRETVIVFPFVAFGCYRPPRHSGCAELPGRYPTASAQWLRGADRHRSLVCTSRRASVVPMAIGLAAVFACGPRRSDTRNGRAAVIPGQGPLPAELARETLITSKHVNGAGGSSPHPQIQTRQHDRAPLAGRDPTPEPP
jgi:hypothetical protein